MPDPGAGRGHIELERRIDSIAVGERHRRDPGDLQPLMDSLRRVGVLQPVTITPDGLLICGYRRLEAAKRLGWNTLRVWVRSGLSDQLTQLLAQRDENATHKALAPLEAADLYKEMKALLREDAARRMMANQFGANIDKTLGASGCPDSGQPATPTGRVARQAALLVTQTASHTRLEQICEMERIAADRSRSVQVRKVAEDELEAIRNGGAVDPSYQRVKAAVRVAGMMTPQTGEDVDSLTDEVRARAKADQARRVKENRQKRAAAAAHARRSTRSFVLTWAELAGWTKHYDAGQVACEIADDDWELFLRVLEETKAFAESVTLAREQRPT